MSKIIFLLSLALMFVSCDLLRDAPYEVEAWTPGEGSHTSPGDIEISILLSLESDKARAEQAFSLTEDRKTMKGYFSWEGRRLIFTPASPLEANRDYAISLGTGAQDLRGLSLESKFEASFTTWPEGGKLRLVATEPGHGESLSGNRGELCIFFSEPIILGSCLDHVSLNPSAPGSWRLLDDCMTACFVPREPWQSGTAYRITLEDQFASVSGSVLGTELSWIFHAGDDKEKPVLLKALARFPDETAGDLITEEITLEKPGFPEAAYTAWERHTLLELVFSKPVDTPALRNLLRVEPSQTLIMESPPEMSDRAIFRLDGAFRWGSSLLFRLGPGVKDSAGNESEEEYLFRIICSGPASKPPVLAGIRLPMAPGNAPAADGESLEHEPKSYSLTDIYADLPIISDENHYPFMEKIPSWVELYFETAPGTEIDLFSVMDLFRVESTNQALGFSPRSIHANDFTWTDPVEDWEKFQRVEIRGFLINTLQSGVVTFRIPAGLADKRGNTSDRDFRISLLK